MVQIADTALKDLDMAKKVVIETHERAAHRAATLQRLWWEAEENKMIDAIKETRLPLRNASEGLHDAMKRLTKMEAVDASEAGESAEESERSAKGR